MPPSRLLAISLGNPAPYANCLHSAGHFALAAVQKRVPSQPSFISEKYGKSRALVSSGQHFTLVQCPTLMNISGPFIFGAWKETLQRYRLNPSDLRLALVHDELEATFGDVRTRKFGDSARGHNGVKSAHETAKGLRLDRPDWGRVMIGIGRPKDRTSDVVSRYVLSPLSREQRDIIDEAGMNVATHLYRVFEAEHNVE
ncbi:peptidyl-tRNA hydrolase [Xylaria sp. CBS 124048]|nr:peptidyl-tRNA hydrolase [Xylaria sp. CBS 124048]